MGAVSADRSFLSLAVAEERKECGHLRWVQPRKQVGLDRIKLSTRAGWPGSAKAPRGRLHHPILQMRPLWSLARGDLPACGARPCPRQHEDEGKLRLVAERRHPSVRPAGRGHMHFNGRPEL